MIDGTSYLDTIAQRLYDGAAQLAREIAMKRNTSTTRDLSAGSAGKFMDTNVLAEATGGSTKRGSGGGGGGAGGLTLQFGQRADFFTGLQSLVGPPDPISLKAGMRKEHTAASDVRAPFVVSNYGTTTTSLTEYHFVVDPSPRTLAVLQLDTWPTEPKLGHDEAARRLRRAPRPLSDFEDERLAVNQRLAATGAPLECTVDMLVGARLYTGPAVRDRGDRTRDTTNRAAALRSC
jgi:hypothetical protein